MLIILKFVMYPKVVGESHSRMVTKGYNIQVVIFGCVNKRP